MIGRLGRERCLVRRAIVAAFLLGSAIWAELAPAASPSQLAPLRPVVVELFTSQGCSTCPPADRLIGRLQRESGGRVIPLAFHVDSWNHQGWADPFSNPAWTRRHAAYARALRAEGVYTPQAVVDGAREVLGSDADRLQAAIAEAAARPAADVRLRWTSVSPHAVAQIEIFLPPVLRDRKLDLQVAVFESGLETPVRRGENGGKVLRDDCVVRAMHRVARLSGDGRPGKQGGSFEIELRRSPEWRAENLGVAAFLQDPRTLSIHGAGAARWPDEE